MKIWKLALVGVIGAIVSACSLYLGPSERSELNEAKARWEAASIIDYRYEIDYSCYCGIYPLRAVVEVRAGAIVSVIDSRTGQPAQQVLNIETIPALFQRIERALDQEADFVSVTYDGVVGYPTLIILDYHRNAIDDESEVRVRNFTILQ